MAEQAREQTTINAPVEQCYRTLIDFESYPEWAGDLKQATVVSYDDEERALVVEYRAAAMGRSTTYRLQYDYDQAPNRLGWELLSGDLERELDGHYELSDGRRAGHHRRRLRALGRSHRADPGLREAAGRGPHHQDRAVRAEGSGRGRAGRARRR